MPSNIAEKGAPNLSRMKMRPRVVSQEITAVSGRSDGASYYLLKYLLQYVSFLRDSLGGGNGRDESIGTSPGAGRTPSG